MEQKEYNFFDYFNSFQQWIEEDNPTDKAIALYMKLFCMMNRRGWQRWAVVDTQTLIGLANATNKVTAYRARDELVRAGLIEYKPGKKGKPSVYRLLCKEKCLKSDTESFTEIKCCKESDTESFTDSFTENFTESFTETEKEREKRKKEAKKEIKREKEYLQDKDLRIIPPYPPRGNGNETRSNNGLTGKSPWRPKLPEGTETRFSESLLSVITDWLTYKHEKREDYKPTGLKSVLTQIEKKKLEFGEGAVMDVIQLSMSNGWKGIIWDKIKPITTSSPQTEAKGTIDDWKKFFEEG